ncbi:MAG: hypothetical protein MUE96_07450 [Bacteroidia bacterium]|jgi:hypothetical protein|nr:hypothetical protein [Bacteroidia bacterium]
MKQQLAIATMHGKEKAIGPVWEPLGFEMVLPESLNTDSFGTFTGEIDRILSPYEAAKAKCISAIQQTGTRYAIASEGSFGPHPQYYWLPADEEWLVWFDAQTQQEIKIKVISTETNFAAKACNSMEEVTAFCKQVFFPSHALIAKRSQTDFQNMHKGITSGELLFELASTWLQQFGSIYLETDMRAMYNPMRMSVIKQAAEKLAKKYQSTCTECGAPGFDVTRVMTGLPCGACATPTSQTRAHVYICGSCGYETKVEFPYGKKQADPQFCPSCNP